ncbi:MAG: hypothetical protein JWN18_104 [Parcubacteria group bacterium]|nr:hypothetical protein [Parcubacteria group bacterium]
MNTHLHPISGVRTNGIRLGAGARLEAGDHYDSASGTWERCPIPGAKLEPGCRVVWIRSTELSPEGNVLLTYLRVYGFYLTLSHHWKVIPSAKWKDDPRMDWKVLHPGAAQDLIDLGFVCERSDSGIYELTDAGRDYGMHFKH